MKIGERITPPFWIEATENAEDIVLNTDNPFDTKEWTQVIQAQILERKLRGVLKRLLTGRRKKLAAHVILLSKMIHAYTARKGTCKVLDFGGGCGDNYAELLRYHHKKAVNQLKYFIIDTPVNCRVGAEKYKKNRNIRFIANDGVWENTKRNVMRLEKEQIDIVFICATLEYIIPYTDLLDILMKLHADYFLLIRNPLCDREKTFYCRQLISPDFSRWKGRYLGDRKVAVVSKRELLSYFEKNAYRLVKEENKVDCSKTYGIGLGKEYKDVYYETLVMQNKESGKTLPVCEFSH